MKLVVRIKLLPSPEQARALEVTLGACNQAANHASQVAQSTGARDKYALQEAIYHDLKSMFALSAQPVVRVLGKVVDAYTTRKANLKAGNLGRKGSKRRTRIESTPICFRSDAAQPFDTRCLSWQMDARTVSIWTVAGRMKNLPFAGSLQQLKTLTEYQQGESDLICQDGQWFLAATCEIPEQPLNESPAGFIGVDLGIVEIATTSEGDRFAGRALNHYRRRQNRLRAKLQAKNTKSTKRLLKRQRRKEARRARDVNHQISKRIVERAERTGHGIALEDLKGIRGRVRQAKQQRAALHSWGFAQLRDFISYKAHRAGYRSRSWTRPTPPSPARSATTRPDATGLPGPCSPVGVVVWCCTPMSMLHATWPTEARSRGTRGASQPPPHPPPKKGESAGRGRSDPPPRWAPTRKPVASATSS